MQYDENGYPVKGQQNRGNLNTAAVATSSSAAIASSPPRNQQPAPLPQHHQQQTGDLRYDERGYPIKPPQQHQLPPNQPHQPIPHQHQQHQQGPRYDERGYPIKSHRNDNRDMSLPVSPPHQPYPSGMNNYSLGNQMGAYNNNQQIQGTQTTGPVLQPYSLQPVNYWSTGLCDIGADFDVCIEGTFCLCCEEGRIYDALENNLQDSMNPFACCASFLCCFFFCLPVVNTLNRRNIIEKYNIQDENCCLSLCFSCLCPCCSSCQIHRELQLRGVYPGGVCCALGKNPDRTHTTVL